MQFDIHRTAGQSPDQNSRGERKKRRVIRDVNRGHDSRDKERKERGKRSMLKLCRQKDRERERERERETDREIDERKRMTWGTKVRKISQTQNDRIYVLKTVV